MLGLPNMLGLGEPTRSVSQKWVLVFVTRFLGSSTLYFLGLDYVSAKIKLWTLARPSTREVSLAGFMFRRQDRRMLAIFSSPCLIWELPRQRAETWNDELYCGTRHHFFPSNFLQ